MAAVFGLVALAAGAHKPKKNKRTAEEAPSVQIADMPTFATDYYGHFPYQFTVHLGQISHDKQTARFLLRDQQGVDFKAYKASIIDDKRVLALHSNTDPSSPTIALVDQTRPYSKRHTVVLPPAPGQEPLDVNGQVQYFVQKVDYVTKKGRLEIPPPYEESYEWQRAKKEEDRWALVRLRDGEILCRVDLVAQPKKVVVENGQTLRATVTFEGKGLVPEELSPFARLAICVYALDCCHSFIRDKLMVALVYEEERLKKEAKMAKKC